MSTKSDGSYMDEKGRLRWHRNDELGKQLQMLYNFLVIGGYEESHARRYPQLAYTISRHHENIEDLKNEGRLSDIPGIGGIVEQIITEFLETGTCAKLEEFAEHTPKSVLELTDIPGLGAKTVGMLYQEYSIDSLATLKQALDADRLKGIKGIGKKTIENMRAHTGDS